MHVRACVYLCFVCTCVNMYLCNCGGFYSEFAYASACFSLFAEITGTLFTLQPVATPRVSSLADLRTTSESASASTHHNDNPQGLMLPRTVFYTLNAAGKPLLFLRQDSPARTNLQHNPAASLMVSSFTSVPLGPWWGGGKGLRVDTHRGGSLCGCCRSITPLSLAIHDLFPRRSFSHG